jgi:uncharacterized Zn-binding protein involved in type VI secretion
MVTIPRAGATKEEYLRVIAENAYQFATSPDGAALWSDDFDPAGVPRNRAEAERYGLELLRRHTSELGGTPLGQARDQAAQYALDQLRQRGPGTLEQTPLGRWLDEQRLFDPDSPLSAAEAQEVWAEASRQYASQASGAVRAFVTGARERSVFRTVELPALVDNPAVTAINGIPREQLQQVYNKSPAAAFNLVEGADKNIRAGAAEAMRAAGPGALPPVPSFDLPTMPAISTGRPQARITDMVACPMVTGLVPHVGGPIATGSPNVIVGNMPAARVTDMVTCVGPPSQIVLGSMTVLINGLQAARIADITNHGGAIVTGYPTVLTGG